MNCPQNSGFKVRILEARTPGTVLYRVVPALWGQRGRTTRYTILLLLLMLVKEKTVYLWIKKRLIKAVFLVASSQLPVVGLGYGRQSKQNIWRSHLLGKWRKEDGG